jgi:tRNA threonylcarbamoyladenosine biosynthesis protein TsaB
MRILSVDTTTESASATVVEDGRLRAETGLDLFGTQSTRLLASVEGLLEALGLNVRDLDGFAVSPGPGSFTGIRVGLSTVQAFAFASGKLIAPVSSLRALAWKHRPSGRGFVCPVLDAKKGEVYGAGFEFEKGRMREVVPQGNNLPERFLARLPKGRKILFAGNGADLIQGLIRAKFKDKAVFSGRSRFIAYEVGVLGADILAAGKGLGPDAVAPLYFRRSQAEEGR